MKIGAFIECVKTTKDTVRHYEELGLLTPRWLGKFKDYSEKDVTDFEVIKEMQALGLNLAHIQQIFQLKRGFGCSSAELLGGIERQLHTILQDLEEKEAMIHQQKEAAQALLTAIKKEKAARS